MEERIIDDEYGRGVVMKKTKDGYVDVTDELAKDDENKEVEENEEEVVFEFPEFSDQDDEELAALMPEQAEELKKKREEERLRKEEEYKELIVSANGKFASQDYEGAKADYEKAMTLTSEKQEAVKGYLACITDGYTNVDAIYEDEQDYGEDVSDYVRFLGSAVKEIGEENKEIFEKKIAELEEEIAPIRTEVEEKQIKRREILSVRKKKSFVGFVVSTALFVVFAILTAIFGVNIPTRTDALYIYLTAGAGLIAFVSLFVFVAKTNKYLNVMRMIKKNENVLATEEGEKYYMLKEQKELFSAFVK